MTPEQLPELEAQCRELDSFRLGGVPLREDAANVRQMMGEAAATIRSLQRRVTELENALRDLVPTAYFGEPATKAEFYAKARKLLQTLT